MSSEDSYEAPVPVRKVCSCRGQYCNTDAKFRYLAEEETPHYAMCFECQGLLHKKDLLTGRYRRKWIYEKDQYGKRIPIYADREEDEPEDAPRQIRGYRRYPGDFIIDQNGNQVVNGGTASMAKINGSRPGINTLEYVDGNGKQVVKLLLDMAASGGGYVEYKWPDPVTRKQAKKLTLLSQFPTP